MTTEEKQAFLAGLHVGVLSIPRPDGGAPLTAPLWYDYTPGGTAWFVIGTNSRKAKLLTEGVQVSLCAQNEQMPYQYVSIEGTVERIAPSTEEIEPMAIRYLGEEMGKQYAAGASAEPNVVVHVRPERWLAVDYSKLG